MSFFTRVSAARASSDAMTFDAPERAPSRVVRTFEDDPPIVLDHRARECDARRTDSRESSPRRRASNITTRARLDSTILTHPHHRASHQSHPPLDERVHQTLNLPVKPFPVRSVPSNRVDVGASRARRQGFAHARRRARVAPRRSRTSPIAPTARRRRIRVIERAFDRARARDDVSIDASNDLRVDVSIAHVHAKGVRGARRAFRRANGRAGELARGHGRARRADGRASRRARARGALGRRDARAARGRARVVWGDTSGIRESSVFVYESRPVVCVPWPTDRPRRVASPRGDRGRKP